MSTNLVETIQKNLGLTELTKIDPNTQVVKGEGVAFPVQNFSQAAVPAVLLGLYKYGSTDQGAQDILSGDTGSSWLDLFYTDKKQEVISKVSSYGNESEDTTQQKMQNIAAEAVKVIREQPGNTSFANVKTYLSQQRSNILVYLPAELQLSQSMEDNTLDDRTHKMEGPMSNAMHFFENLFSGSTTEKNEVDDKS